MPPQGIVNEDKQQQLPQDNSTPFSAPSSAAGTGDDTHPQTDTNIDSHEHYDEGVSGAAETDDPGDRGIIQFNPPNPTDKT